MYYEKGYLTYLLKENDVIYIDTCSLMNTDSIRLFIGRAETEFLYHQKKIIVPFAVIKELEKKTADSEKCFKANEALAILQQFDDIFEIEEAPFNHEYNCSHADAYILARITADKAKYAQLLITSDRGLSKDAFALNCQESNKGRKVMVCHITRKRYINKCACVNQERETEAQKQIKPEVITEEKIIYVDRPIEVDREDEAYRWWQIPVVFVCGVAGGIAIDRYAVPVLKKALNAVA